MAAIVTPEGVRLDFEAAGLCSRMLSRLVDSVFQLMLVYAIATASIAFGNQTAAIVFTSVAFFLVVFGYPVLTEVLWQGRSIGKNALGLRLVTTDGSPVRFRHAAIRSMLQRVDFIVVPGGAIALVSGACTGRNQRLGDVAAGTFAVRERRPVAGATAVSFPPPYGLAGYVQTLDVATVSASQYATIRSFLLRVPTLADNARLHLAHRLALPLARALHHTPPPGVSPELFLVCVASAYQLRHSTPTAAVKPQPPARPRGPSRLAPPPPPPRGPVSSPPFQPPS
jgi:uncharacterized RDD family membrane protein YckC